MRVQGVDVRHKLAELSSSECQQSVSRNRNEMPDFDDKHSQLNGRKANTVFPHSNPLEIAGHQEDSQVEFKRTSYTRRMEKNWRTPHTLTTTCWTITWKSMTFGRVLTLKHLLLMKSSTNHTWKQGIIGTYHLLGEIFLAWKALMCCRLLLVV